MNATGVIAQNQKSFNALLAQLQSQKHCADPLGALQNFATAVLNAAHPVGGLSVHIDDTKPKAIRITQHPDAGNFEETIYLLDKEIKDEHLQPTD